MVRGEVGELGGVVEIFSFAASFKSALAAASTVAFVALDGRGEQPYIAGANGAAER